MFGCGDSLVGDRLFGRYPLRPKDHDLCVRYTGST